MLIELFGRNFGPFRDEFRLSMMAADIDPGDPRGIIEVPVEGEVEPLRLLRCAAIYGPNASGKSQVLRAASALGYLLSESAGFKSDESIPPYEPFLLDESSREAAVMLGLRAVVDGREYEYEIGYDESRFVLERLVELTRDGEKELFKREGQKVCGLWTSEKQFELFESFRPNALLLSLADRLAPSLAGGIAPGLRRLLGHRDFASGSWPWGASRVAERATKDVSGFRGWLLDWIQHADVGIVGYDTVKLVIESEADEPERPVSRRPRLPDRAFVLKHASPVGPVPLHYFKESVGTHKMIELAPYIHDLTHGDAIRAFFIDEIGASIHPHMLEAVIRHFNCDTPVDQVRGQFIFATHETSVLEGEARYAPLRRDQVYLTEKDPAGVSRLYSVADFKERQNLNVRKRYLQGRYGALPSPGRFGG